ncbi:FAD binding domain-containing protein [Colletotrichum higginsianum]|uniref:FAD binding domain-containing protein n=2 Tax=Colletotrichum higginsianum TaxID=80884 RepID=H1V1B7_COLHI|nr:FAD binding domain-containing protein [Colletotrichum higginsianum IMI 349063]OBR16425.1 FAD binding domain-containing protein [Colletotrichum higginsianum IMI 349063]TID03806.1 Bifunctional solanapyrone synthase [Colletotrichum higginsianum]CCF34019.1 FAD binding domain-containing protein [Colletotrichum higginsianum]
MVSKAAFGVASGLIIASLCHGEEIPGALDGKSSAIETCRFLSRSHPDITYFPNTTDYTAVNEDYFTAASWLGPRCIFAPTNAELMSLAVKVLRKTNVPFALRGGGHMPIAGSNNIDSTGILLSSSNLKQLRLSRDKSTVFVEPGNDWGDVYRFLDPHGLSAVGGRLGIVGVPGFLLGGGISFFGNEHGWASANVKSVKAVLADGKIVTATADNKYSDLFWALRGGGNSFAIATEFELNAVKAPVVTVGNAIYGVGLRDKFLDSVFDFALDGTLDKKAAVIPNVHWSGTSPDHPFYASYLFYNGNNTRPSALANFTGASLAGNLEDFKARTMGEWATAGDGELEAIHGLHFRFHIVSIVASKEAMRIIHDTFLSFAQEHLVSIPGIGTTLTFMPISESFLTTRRGGGPRGDPMGIDASKAPFIWVEESIIFARGEDEERATWFLEITNKEIQARLKPLNVGTPYLYLNDADKNQPVFEGYDRANLRRLQGIRAKYDPDMVFTKQMPGGFKVAGVR